MFDIRFYMNTFAKSKPLYGKKNEFAVFFVLMIQKEWKAETISCLTSSDENICAYIYLFARIYNNFYFVSFTIPLLLFLFLVNNKFVNLKKSNIMN